MNTINAIIEKLEIIEKKIDGKLSNRFLNINQVSKLTTLSCSTIRRAIKKGHLKYKKRLGKLLFLESDVRKWLNG
jgi:predicted DNA-binding transcriptional regulator AlpA